MIIPDHKLFTTKNKLKISSLVLPGFPFGVTKSNYIVSGQYSIQRSWGTSNGTGVIQNWIVPNGVTSISILCIGWGGVGTYAPGSCQSGGGGGLAYTITVPTTPGETLTLVIGHFDSQSRANFAVKRDDTVLCRAECAQGRLRGGSASIQVGDVYFGGGNGVDQALSASGGGGAAGYGADGGAGGNGTGAALPGNGGGGVGVLGSLGQTAGATGGTPSGVGLGTSGGANGTSGTLTGAGGNFGGGAGAAYQGATLIAGAPGIIRIIWGQVENVDRAYPNTYTADV